MNPPTGSRPPLYPRLLRLHHLDLTSWQRAVYVEGVFLLALVLVLADLATAWTLLALPLVTAGMVKFLDVLAGAMRPPGRPPGRGRG
ncbi:MAG: hypothetical protein ACYDAQ_04485 [Mycobacteriales bacterium]